MPQPRPRPAQPRQPPDARSLGPDVGSALAQAQRAPARRCCPWPPAWTADRINGCRNRNLQLGVFRGRTRLPSSSRSSSMLRARAAAVGSVAQLVEMSIVERREQQQSCTSGSNGSALTRTPPPGDLSVAAAATAPRQRREPCRCGRQLDQGKRVSRSLGQDPLLQARRSGWRRSSPGARVTSRRPDRRG